MERAVSPKGHMVMRDIDYAALAVRKQIEEKFGRREDLAQLEVRADESTIAVEHGELHIAGTRDNLMAALRKATTYQEFFAATFPNHHLRR